MMELKQMLSSMFKMKDLGALHYIIDWEIKRDQAQRSIFIIQRKYAATVLERFSMSECNGCDVPITGDIKLSKAMCASGKDELGLMATRPYRAWLAP